MPIKTNCCPIYIRKATGCISVHYIPVAKEMKVENANVKTVTFRKLTNTKVEMRNVKKKSSQETRE